MEGATVLGYYFGPPDGAAAPGSTNIEVLVEQQSNSAGVSRSQNLLHVLPEDFAAGARLIEPLLERVDPAATQVQLLVITSDAEAAAGVAARIEPSEDRVPVVAITEPRRALRVVRKTTPRAIAGSADDLVALAKGAALKLDAVKVVVFAWVGSEDAGIATIETLMADVPKEAARMVLTADVTPAIEQLIERFAWRARRLQGPAVDAPPPVALSYVSTADHGREVALRRTLDTLDPESAFVVAKEPRSRVAVESLLRTLGHGVGANEAIRVGAAPEGAADVVVLYDMPTSAHELRELVRGVPAARVVALVTPRQVATLRALAGGSVAPLTLPDAAVRARSREERIRDELRAALESQQFSREVLTLEPLLSEHDGVEVAAALLRLLEAERAKARTPQIQAQHPAAVTRLYFNVGTSDEVRPGDLVGAITNEAGISKSDLGRVDVRDRHSTVEVSASVANAVVAKLTGVQIKGRRVIARVDEDRPRERPKRSDDGRGERRGAPRGGPRGPRGPRDGSRGGPPRGRPTRERT